MQVLNFFRNRIIFGLLLCLNVILHGCAKNENGDNIKLVLARTNMRSNLDYLNNYVKDIVLGSFPVEEKFNGKCRTEYVIPKKLRELKSNAFVPTLSSLTDEKQFYDIFPHKKCKMHHPLQYLSNGSWVILISCGPDGEYQDEFMNWIYSNKNNIDSLELQNAIIKNQFDCTNGTFSKGDIILFTGFKRDFTN